MSTIDTKIAKSIKLLQMEYSMIMGSDAIGLYYKLLWLRDNSLGMPMTNNYIISKTLGIHWKSTEALMKKLKAFGLIGRTKVGSVEGTDWAWKINGAKKLTKEEKKQAVFDMYKSVAIAKEEHDILIQYIDETEEPEMTSEEAEDVIDKTYNNVDFEIVKKKIGADTGMGLVIYYYQLLGEVFGGQYKSRNLGNEAVNLKECMLKNGDTPEKTREYFRWVIKKHKRENRFEKVHGLGLYPEHRKEAYYAIEIQKKGDKKFEEIVEDIPKEDKMINDMKNVYAVYMRKEMSHEDAISKMRENFAPQAVDKFLEIKNAQ